MIQVPLELFWNKRLSLTLFFDVSSPRSTFFTHRLINKTQALHRSPCRLASPKQGPKWRWYLSLLVNREVEDLVPQMQQPVELRNTVRVVKTIIVEWGRPSLRANSVIATGKRCTLIGQYAAKRASLHQSRGSTALIGQIGGVGSAAFYKAILQLRREIVVF